ncbi:MAG TPA: HAMP domain-containing sensor histidine kinase, partial [Allocoleopsis sp.]
SLLDLARADTGCMYLRPEDINLNELVNDVVKMSERSHQRQIKIDADVKNIKLYTDRDCLSQALTHLIENAVKYSPIDQPILIQLAQDHGQITIQVRDFGCGIASEQQQRIFEPFYRVDDTRCRNTGGVGLGLALVKTLIEHIDGQIQLWSQPGEGSLFTITLPAQLKS